jgi:hypothetical protein
MSMTVSEILRGTGTGATQSAGQMQVVPLLGDDDATFAPPVLEVGTAGYGSVVLRNDGDRPIIVPPGAGWVVPQKAQDHAIGGGALLRPSETRQIDTAMCIQQSQGGLISKGKHELLILPATLRAKALGVRHVKDFRKLWDGIGSYNRSFGIEQSGGHLEFFLRQFQAELARFVAEFEVVPRQVGAIVLIGGKVAGIERAPSADCFRAVFTALIRVCYGSLALQVGRERTDPPATRVPLVLAEKTLDGLRRALADADRREQAAVDACVSHARSLALTAASDADDTLGPIALKTVASPGLAGQVVTVKGAVRFASVCVAA